MWTLLRDGLARALDARRRARVLRCRAPRRGARRSRRAARGAPAPRAECVALERAAGARQQDDRGAGPGSRRDAARACRGGPRRRGRPGEREAVVGDGARLERVAPAAEQIATREHGRPAGARSRARRRTSSGARASTAGRHADRRPSASSPSLLVDARRRQRVGSVLLRGGRGRARRRPRAGPRTSRRRRRTAGGSSGRLTRSGRPSTWPLGRVLRPAAGQRTTPTIARSARDEPAEADEVAAVEPLASGRSRSRHGSMPGGVADPPVTAPPGCSGEP